MNRIARDLTRPRLTAAGIDPLLLTALVSDMDAARAAAINREGLEAQLAFLLEAYGPAKIESLALRNNEGQP